MVVFVCMFIWYQLRWVCVYMHVYKVLVAMDVLKRLVILAGNQDCFETFFLSVTLEDSR